MIRAIIFDLDGTLVNTEPLKASAYARAASDLLGRPVGESEVASIYREVVGLPREFVAKALAKRMGLPEQSPDGKGSRPAWEALAARWLDVYAGMIDAVRPHDTSLCPHSFGLLKEARSRGLRTGLATMSSRKQVQTIMDHLGIGSDFDAIVTVDEVRRGKPDPEIYASTALALGVAPEECLVIEDSTTGIAAALAAGMACIAVTSAITAGSVHRSRLLDERWIVDDPSRLSAVAWQRIGGGDLTPPPGDHP